MAAKEAKCPNTGCDGVKGGGRNKGRKLAKYLEGAGAGAVLDDCEGGRSKMGSIDGNGDSSWGNKRE